MTQSRNELLGPPHTYLIQGEAAFGRDIFSDPGERADFIAAWSQVCATFDLRCYGWRLQPSSYALCFRHRHHWPEPDHLLAERWAKTNRRSNLSGERLRERLSSLSGVMQTLIQQYSKRYNTRHNSKGSIWAGRYRACLLADDAAVLTTVVSIEHAPSLASSQQAHCSNQDGPPLARLPICELPNGSVLPLDEAPMGMVPPMLEQEQRLFDQFAEECSPEDRAIYAQAIQHSWCLGKPESLAGAMNRLGRSKGRGRSRRRRELDDALGLCGLWG